MTTQGVQSATGTRTLSTLEKQPIPLAFAAPDVETMMLVATIDQRDAQEASAKGAAQKNTAEHDQQLRESKEAEQRAREANEHAGIFGKWTGRLSALATAAGCIAAVASVVASGGVTAPAAIMLIGAALSASAPMMKEVAGEKVGDAMMWAGVATSLVGGGLGLAGVGAAAAEQAQVTVGQELALWAARVSRGIEGSARIGEGGSRIAEKHWDSKAIDDQADAAASRARAKKTRSEMDDLIANVEQLEASTRRAITAVLRCEEEQQHGRAEIIARIGRSVTA